MAHRSAKQNTVIANMAEGLVAIAILPHLQGHCQQQQQSQQQCQQQCQQQQQQQEHLQREYQQHKHQQHEQQQRQQHENHQYQQQNQHQINKDEFNTPNIFDRNVTISIDKNDHINNTSMKESSLNFMSGHSTSNRIHTEEDYIKEEDVGIYEDNDQSGSEDGGDASDIYNGFKTTGKDTITFRGLESTAQSGGPCGAERDHLGIKSDDDDDDGTSRMSESEINKDNTKSVTNRRRRDPHSGKDTGKKKVTNHIHWLIFLFIF